MGCLLFICIRGIDDGLMSGDVGDALVLGVVNAVEGAGDGLLLVPARLGHAVKLLRLPLLLLLLLLAGLLLDKGQVIPNPVT